MIKGIFERLYRIIFQPTKAWNTLVNEKEEEIIDNDSFFETYLYPIIGIVALLTFVGALFHESGFTVHNVQLALKRMIGVAIALFAGFYLASYLLSEIIVRFFSGDKQYKLCQRFVGYSSALIYMMYMVLAIFPVFSFLSIFLLYTVYIVWEGIPAYIQIPENEKNKFVIIAAGIILLSPVLIEKILTLMMPNMKS